MNVPKDAKCEALRRQGVLHAHPQDVTDSLFQAHEFFDPRDLVQVKYEMLRRVQVEGLAITTVTGAFGFSRPTFYQAQASYQQHGLPGLVSQRPGPHHAHKLSDEILDFVLQQRSSALRVAALCVLVEETFGVTVHPRSLERALARRRKKRRQRLSPIPRALRSRGRQGTKTCGARFWKKDWLPLAVAGVVPW